MSGLFNFTQSGLDALTHRTFGNDPVPVNIILLCLAFIVGATLVGFVYRKKASMARDWLEGEAEDAVEALMPNIGISDEEERSEESNDTTG